MRRDGEGGAESCVYSLIMKISRNKALIFLNVMWRGRSYHLNASRSCICRFCVKMKSAGHYTELAKQTHGVNDGFYPLGSCTMKYNPKINDALASLGGFTEIHPLQDLESVQGCLELMKQTEKALCTITGMDAMTFQPAAGAHGEFCGLLLIKKYHEMRNDLKRNKIIIPDSAHGTNPASASMAGFKVVTIASKEDGCVDLDALRQAVGEDTAGLMLTNPNTVGLFDKHILEITQIIHDAGGLNYYDGSNLNAIMGIARPGDMGFELSI